MQKFKFKLAGLLKLREFKENKLKVELGHINREIEETKLLIKKLNNDLDEGYDAHEKILYKNAGGSLIRFFPEFFQAKREDIKNKENFIFALQRKMELKREELAQARGEVKVIENLKDKKKQEYNKEMLKKEELMIEDLLMMRKNGDLKLNQEQ